MDDIRRALAATTDPVGRGRIRVRLADALVACGELAAAAAELKQAAAEAPASVGLLFGVRVLSSRLSPAEAGPFLDEVNGHASTGRRRLVGPRPPGALPTALPRDDTQPILLPLPSPAPLVTAVPPAAPRSATDRLEQAFVALAAGKPVWARRLGEEVARGPDLDEARSERLNQLVEAIDRAGGRRQALFLARTLVELTNEGTAQARAGETLSGLVAKALEADDVELALRWGADLGRPLAQMARAEPRAFVGPNDSLERRFRRAQAAIAVAHTDRERAAAVESLLPLLSGSPGGTAALALAVRFTDRRDGAAASRRAALLETAFTQELTPEGRERLARRWLQALEDDETAPLSAESLAGLERAIGELSPARTVALRARRAALLRRRERDAELVRALEADAELATGPRRAALLAEQAELLEHMGQAERALEIRIGALVDAPADPALLAPARRRLEALGQGERSLELALVALPHVRERSGRIAALRDVAALAESAAEDRGRAATAWLELLTLEPADRPAFEAAERLLRGLGDEPRLTELLAWAVARTDASPELAVAPARLGLLWRLAEHRRRNGRLPAALGHYREIIEARGRRKEDESFGDDWRRRDDQLAVETARTLAAPDAEARARALTDRALVSMALGRLDEAERDLTAAFDLGPATGEVLVALEKLHEQRGDWRGLRQRLQARVGLATGAVAGRIWLGIGRASERLGDVTAAEAAYVQARNADENDRAPLSALRRLAFARRDWAAVSTLLEKEIERVRVSSERVELLVQQGTLLAEKLGRADRAVEVLDAALGFQPTNADALEAMFNAALAAGAWEKAAQALEVLLAAGPLGDAAERYFRIGRAAESGGKVDRALGFYSRSYARNSAYRPSLERLSEICFDRQQWDNAWKATEHLLDRHGSDLEPSFRAELALRSAHADLHVAQRLTAVARVAAMKGLPATGGGVRDVAESWASMRFDPLLLGGIDDDRRGRVLSRLKEISLLTEHDVDHPARHAARETWAALAMVDRRFADAVEALDAFAADETIDVKSRALFAVTAGDILLHEQGDVGGAGLRYERARALNPSEPRLARTGVVQVADESTDESPPSSHQKLKG
ncbi:MAG TPA: hypothetical protein VGP07_05460 [Polyangia bacterium]|jgi:tetratricopeptide (TPR) repeat protein